MHLLHLLAQRYFIVLLITVISLLSVVGSLYFLDGLPRQFAGVVASVTVYFVGIQTLASPEAARQRSVRFSIYVFGFLSFGLLFSKNWILPIVTDVIARIWPSASTSLILGADQSLWLGAALIFVLHLTTMYFLGRRSSEPLGEPTWDKINESNIYRERRKTFVRVLQTTLLQVDHELRWHQRDFIRLQASVDIQNANKRRRRVVDLVTGLKKNKDAKIFVVLGIPGAGKSVALRKTCAELLDKSTINSRIPVYVNLKEWPADRSWTAQNPPTHEDFAAFVENNVRDRFPNNARTFFNENYAPMVERGEIFFVFDSFDEIPGIMDSDESSELLRKVSDIIVGFISSQWNTRGIIASRHYRRPRLGQIEHAVLEVRPFSDAQISEAIANGTGHASQLEEEIFASRPDLVAISRNPFLLSLLMLFWAEKRALPNNQYELFAAYISESIEGAQEHLKQFGFDQKELWNAMSQISWAMFDSDRRGLELTMDEIRELLGLKLADKLVDALVAARLVRKASLTQAVSFVHRRFNEFFLVDRWIDSEKPVNFEAIPTDTRYRDAMVLYAEVANDSSSKKLADFCWDEISKWNPADAKSGDPTQTLRAMYCLRFMAEAYRARTSLLAGISEALGSKIVDILQESDNLVSHRLAIEAVGIVDTKSQQEVVEIALLSKNHWLLDATISACRFLPQISTEAQLKLIRIIRRRGPFSLLLPSKDQTIAFRNADVFSSVEKNLSLARVEILAYQAISVFAFVGAIHFGVGGSFGMFFLVAGSLIVIYFSPIVIIGDSQIIRTISDFLNAHKIMERKNKLKTP